MTLSMLDLEGAAIGSRFPLEHVLNALPWNNDGLIAAIAQQHGSGEVLMLAWMNRQALNETLATGHVSIGRARGNGCGARAKAPAIGSSWWRPAWTATVTRCC